MSEQYYSKKIGIIKSLREARVEAQGKTLQEARTEVETMEVCGLARSSWLIQARATCLEITLPTLGWILLHTLEIKKMVYRHLHMPV